jgi:hypothetical protein
MHNQKQSKTVPTTAIPFNKPQSCCVTVAT